MRSNATSFPVIPRLIKSGFWELFPDKFNDGESTDENLACYQIPDSEISIL